MTTLREFLDACDAQVRGHLEPGEQVLATGRCEDITEWGDIGKGGTGWTYAMVTNRRLRWIPRVRPEYEASLVLDDVVAVEERSEAHRYAIRLKHQPIVRPRWGPAHRFLMFRWGNSVTSDPLKRTELAFSRRDTEAARAMRRQLRDRGSNLHPSGSLADQP